MPKIIYLDSADYSDLSAPTDQISCDDKNVLAALQRAQVAGSAQCVLSAIHLSEAVHATPNPSHRAAAIRRTALMEELCKGHHVRTPDQLLKIEIKKALGNGATGRLTTNELLSGPHEWFGIKLNINFDEKRIRLREKIDARLSHLPRRDRRKIKSQLNLANATGREYWRQLFRASSQPSQEEFPFGLVSDELVQGWFTGEKSDREFLKALLGLMNRPRTMVEHLLDADEQSTIYSFLRDEGVKMKAKMETRLQETMRALNKLFQLDQAFPFAKEIRKTIPKHDFYRNVIESYGAVSLNVLSDTEVEAIIDRCPAASTLANAYIAYACSIFEANVQSMKSGRNNIRTGQTSDFGDLMHAVYAPYCNVFRCDAHFGSLLRQNPTIRDRIVNKRKSLMDLETFTAA